MADPSVTGSAEPQAPSAADVRVGREVLCRPITFFFREFERQGRDPARLLAGIEHSRERLCDRHGRVEWESFRRLLENAGRVWDDAALIEVGRRITVSRWLAPFAGIARLMISCREIYRWNFEPVRGVSKQCFSCLENAFEERTATRFVVRSQMAPGYAPSRELFLICRGSLENIPRLLGLPPASVGLRFDGAAAHYEVEHVARGGALAWLRRGLGWPRMGKPASEDLEALSSELSARADALESEATTRARTEAALRESELKFEKVFHAAPTYMIVSTAEGRIIDINESFEHASGYTRSELIGRNTSEFPFWKRPEDRMRLVRGLAAGNPVRSVEVEFRNREGRDYVGLLAADTIALGGEACLIWQITDITARKAAESENRRLQERMLRARKFESLGVMAGGIAHDFNNLLVGILGNAELASAEVEPGSPMADRVEAISEAATRAADLTREMLAYAGKARLERAAIDLGPLVDQTAILLRCGLPRGIEIRCRPSGEPTLVDGDPAQIRQIVTSLVTNAAESYAEETGSVEIRVDAPAVDQALLDDAWPAPSFGAGRCARIEVADRGCGMDDTTLKRIFDPFYSTKFIGRGLGLAATLGIVKQHGGCLRVVSSPGQGTRVQVLIPLIERPADTAPGRPVEAGGNGPSLDATGPGAKGTESAP